MLKLLNRKFARTPKNYPPDIDDHVLMRALEEIAAKGATGRLTVRGAAGSRAHIYAFDGELYAVELEGYQPPVDLRLHSGGHLDRAQLAELVLAEPGSPAQRARTAATRGWLSIEDLGLVHHEFVLAAFGALLLTQVTSTSFTEGAATGEVCAVPVPIDVLREAAQFRQTRMAEDWSHVTDLQPAEERILQPTTGQLPDDCQLPEFVALFGELDGQKSLAQAAYRCGYTLAEAVHLVSALKMRSLLTAGGSTAESEALLVPEAFPYFAGVIAVDSAEDQPENSELSDRNVEEVLTQDEGRTHDVDTAVVEALREELARALAHVEVIRAQLERVDVVLTDA
ncbi:MAG: hypothetical protein Q8L05_04105 [Actinomycetota bacterium]|nr:hypothetical protein [Actinomycetota bacterium]MDP2289404.1 hypothetical protein [Actinomycetota bacterium]